jgi:integrase
MTLQRHIFTNLGHSIHRSSSISRLFNVCKYIFNFRTDGDSNKELCFQLTNSEYHLTSVEINKLIDGAASMRDRGILCLLAETGIRRAELSNLSIDDIQWQEKQLIIRQGKGNKTRIVPVTTRVINNLQMVIADRRIGPVFVSRNGGKLSMRQVNRIVARAGMIAEIKNPNPKYQHVTPHLLRHSFARLWKDRGGNIEALSKILGHQSVRTTWDLYGTLGMKDIQLEYHKIMKPAKKLSIQSELVNTDGPEKRRENEA